VYNTVGSNGTPNTLHDDPGGWGPNTYFDAVDVAVCFKSDNCQNRILGYYFWSFFDDSSGVAHEFITAPAWQDLNIEFQNAVASWNTWAPTSGPIAAEPLARFWSLAPFHSQLCRTSEGKRMKLRIAFASLVALACLCAAGCERKPGETAVQARERAELAEQDRLVAQTAQAYRAMDNAALLKKLEEQSARKREPFNSLAYRELVTRKNVDPKELVAIINEKSNADSLLPLLLLRKLDENTYAQIPADVRCGILTDALETSKTFNTWGLPGFYLEDASKATAVGRRHAL
jgi:hypothetical protein